MGEIKNCLHSRGTSASLLQTSAGTDAQRNKKKIKTAAAVQKKKKEKKLSVCFLKQLLLHNTVIFASLTC